MMRRTTPQVKQKRASLKRRLCAGAVVCAAWFVAPVAASEPDAEGADALPGEIEAVLTAGRACLRVAADAEESAMSEAEADMQLLDGQIREMAARMHAWDMSAHSPDALRDLVRRWNTRREDAANYEQLHEQASAALTELERAFRESDSGCLIEYGGDEWAQLIRGLQKSFAVGIANPDPNHVHRQIVAGMEGARRALPSVKRLASRREIRDKAASQAAEENARRREFAKEWATYRNERDSGVIKPSELLVAWRKLCQKWEVKGDSNIPRDLRWDESSRRPEALDPWAYVKDNLKLMGTSPVQRRGADDRIHDVNVAVVMDTKEKKMHFLCTGDKIRLDQVDLVVGQVGNDGVEFILNNEESTLIW